MKHNVIKSKSFVFALNTIAAYKFLAGEKREYVLSKQLLRSGTAVGAHVNEAEHAESKPTLFINLELPRKKQMKQIIGCNCSFSRDTLTMEHSNSLVLRLLKLKKSYLQLF